MRGIALQDSGRSGKTGWAVDLVQSDVAGGIILSPFTTPKVRVPRRPAGQEVVDAIYDAGGEAFLDPMTHAATWPSTNDWDIYDRWTLWSGARGDLSTRALRHDHVLRVVEEQLQLGLTPLAPTLSLVAATGADAEASLELAAITRSQGPDIALAVVGTSAFWSQGTLLDDYIGQIAQLRPSHVFISMARADLAYPPVVLRREIDGLCRSVNSLARRAEVIVQYADYFGLPAIAAGASAVGSGWDLRQRMLAPDAFRLTTTIRRTAHRITYAGLYGVLKRVEAERLVRADRPLSARLVPGVLPANGNPLWQHHLKVLAAEVDAVSAVADREASAKALSAKYVTALTSFGLVEPLAQPLEAGATRWLNAVAGGITDYINGEGW